VGSEALRGRGSGVPVEVEHGDGGALLGEALGGRGTDTAGRSGDDGDTTGVTTHDSSSCAPLPGADCETWKWAHCSHRELRV
jgi:hypothetical protein